jgi:hypothetical protein
MGTMDMVNMMDLVDMVDMVDTVDTILVAIGRAKSSGWVILATSSPSFCLSRRAL